MKTIVWLFIFLLVAVGLAIFGNMLRCMSARSEVCPAWCLPKKIQCLDSTCEKQIKCQSPSFVDYWALISHWLEDQSGGKIKI